MTSFTALVTGATGGIGLHIARQFGEQGWTVLVGARDAARGDEAAAQLIRCLEHMFKLITRVFWS